MSVLDRAVCLVRGHSWAQRSDPAGTILLCSRCGKLRHTAGASEVPLQDRYQPPTGGE